MKAATGTNNYDKCNAATGDMRLNGTDLKYYHFDELGSTLLLTDASGVQRESAVVTHTIDTRYDLPSEQTIRCREGYEYVVGVQVPITIKKLEYNSISEIFKIFEDGPLVMSTADFRRNPYILIAIENKDPQFNVRIDGVLCFLGDNSNRDCWFRLHSIVLGIVVLTDPDNVCLSLDKDRNNLLITDKKTGKIRLRRPI